MTFTTSPHRLVLTLALAAVAACGSSGSGDDDDQDPQFLVATRVFDAANSSSVTSYLHAVPSLEAGTTVDQSKALEIAGSAKLYSIPDVGWFAIGSGEKPTITKYTLERGAFVKGLEMSFINQGVKALWPTLYVVSATKAYYPDRDGLQLIVWNPTTMEIRGTIALPQTAQQGFLANYGNTPILRGDKLLFTVGWFDWVTTDTIRPETGLVVIDTRTDTVARFDTDTRCGGIDETVVAPSGDAYLISSALAGSACRLGRLSTTPCALRVKAGADAIDPGYRTDLDGLAGGKVT